MGVVGRIPVMLRALLLVPLFAVAVDHLRVSAFCSSGTQTCLEAAGGGLIGPLGFVVLGAYAAVLAAGVGRLAQRGTRPPSLTKLWLTSSAGVLAIIGGHTALAAALGQGATTGGGWLQLLPLVLAAGAVLAILLRAAPAALKLLRRLRPRTPRPRATSLPLRRPHVTVARALSRIAALTAAGRAPPLLVG